MTGMEERVKKEIFVIDTKGSKSWGVLNGHGTQKKKNAYWGQNEVSI